MADQNKRKNKSKPEIVQDIKTIEKTYKNRKFVREEFYPILCLATESINDADVFLQSFSSMVMESFLGFMKEKKFSDLDLVSKLDPKSPQYESIKKMIELFNDMNIKDANMLIDGLKDEIRYFYKKEMETRKLDSLKTMWLGEEHE